MTALLEPPTRSRRFVGALRKPRVAIPFVALSIYFVLAIIGPWIAPYDPLELAVGETAQGPSSEHLFGTDAFGRDQLSRVLAGTRLSVGVALAVAASATAIGLPIGMIAGYRRGTFDQVTGRIVDGVFAFPTLLLAFTLAAILGGGIPTAILALTVTYMPIVARFVRSAVIAEGARPYVTAAKTLGLSDWRIVARHIAPNIVSPLLVLVTSIMALAVLAEAALSFLGVGAQPPAPSWGRMMTENRAYLTTVPTLILLPGAALTGLVLSLNLFGDAARDELDPDRTPS